MRALRTVLAALTVAAAAAPAAAADIAFGVEGGWQDLTASRKSAKAVFDGSSGGATFGAMARYGLGRRFFVAAGARWFEKTGERVFTSGALAPVFKLGHPLKVRILPVYGLVGFRLLPDSVVRPYVAAGPGYTSYREESDVAGVVEKFSETVVSGHAAVGAEFGRGSVRFGVEGMYTTVPDVVGAGGVSRIYGESDMGGFSAVARIVVGR